MKEEKGTSVERAREIGKRHGFLRANMEAFGMAILMAVLLKYFAIEAYVIPTPSMQPTMMGSSEAGLRDRILVDKIRYEIVEPKRWDVAVFRYPERQIQSYVKRIVGVGPEQFLIAGGNIYTRKQDNDPWQIQRKPDSLQERLWKEILPMRLEMEASPGGAEDDKLLPNYIYDSRGRWSEKVAGVLTINVGSKGNAELSFNDVRHDRFANNIYDGYDAEVARLVKMSNPKTGPTDPSYEHSDNGKWQVPDVRMGYAIRPSQTPAKVTLDLTVSLARLSFRLVIENTKARLLVVETGKSGIPEKTLLESPAFEFDLSSGETTSVRCAHVDDQLIAWRNGDEVQRLLCDDHRVMDDLKSGQVKATLSLTGGGKVQISDIKIERDLHYTRSGKDLAVGEVLKIPAGHFFMMGDNTLGSADSRAWKSITIGVDADGWVIDPKSPKAVRVLRGNKRPRSLDLAPIADDNPFPCMQDGKDWLAFGDHLGQMHRLRAKVSRYGWGASLDKRDAELIQQNGKRFVPPEEYDRFVPRSHIQGRPLTNFFRSFDRFFYRRSIR